MPDTTARFNTSATFFTLIESSYYGFENYDGWREVGNNSRANPQDDLDEFLDRTGMRRLQVDDDGDFDDGAKDNSRDSGICSSTP